MSTQRRMLDVLQIEEGIRSSKVESDDPCLLCHAMQQDIVFEDGMWFAHSKSRGLMCDAETKQTAEMGFERSS